MRNVKESYQLNKITNLSVKGENLLALHNNINTGYSMLCATVIGGINLNF
ncbi:hypothetical protein [Dysgonomonas sp. 216]|nr:hypothetical protein [Dysgonomonas sp. 216]